MQRFIIGKSAEKNDFWVFNPERDIYVNPSKPQAVLQKREERETRSEEGERHHLKLLFLYSDYIWSLLF